MGIKFRCVTLIVRAHTHTDLQKVTDTGLKAFSAALGSSTTIIKVELDSKYECLACLYECVHVMLCMRVCSVGGWGLAWCCVCGCVCSACGCGV